MEAGEELLELGTLDVNTSSAETGGRELARRNGAILGGGEAFVKGESDLDGAWDGAPKVQPGENFGEGGGELDMNDESGELVGRDVDI